MLVSFKYWSCDQTIKSIGQLGASFVYLHLFDGCLALKVVSDLPVYRLLHKIHSIRYIRYFILQLTLLYISKVLYVTVLLKVLVTCVHHKLFNLELQDPKTPFWSMFDIAVLLTLVFLPRIFCRFLFCLKAIIGCSVKTYSKSLFIFNLFWLTTLWAL